MSGGKGGSQTSKVEIPSWIQQPSIRNMARAEDVQQIGYQPYMGPDVAGFTQPQQQAMQSNLDAAAAFGLIDPGMNAMDGMPQATDYDGLSGYSSFPLYEQAVNDMKEANPRQAQAYDSLFVGGDSDGPTYPGPRWGGPWGRGGPIFSGGGYPGGMPDNQLASGPDMSNYFTMDQVNDLFANQQGPDLSAYATTNDLSQAFDGYQPPQPDLSGYATNESVSSQFDNFKPTGPAPYDDSGIMDLIRGNQSAIQNIPTYDDSQLRNDIDDRFNSFQADAGVKPAPRDLWDDSVPVVNQGLDMLTAPKMLQNFNRRKV